MDTKPAAENPPPTRSESEISAALKEHDAATDRVAVIIKYPWLVPVLNQRQNQPKTK